MHLSFVPGTCVYCCAQTFPTKNLIPIPNVGKCLSVLSFPLLFHHISGRTNNCFLAYLLFLETRGIVTLETALKVTCPFEMTSESLTCVQTRLWLLIAMAAVPRPEHSDVILCISGSILTRSNCHSSDR